MENLNFKAVDLDEMLAKADGSVNLTVIAIEQLGNKVVVHWMNEEGEIGSTEMDSTKLLTANENFLLPGDAS